MDFHHLELRHARRTNYEKAVSFFRQAAEKGDSNAVYMLGRCHESGCGLAKDHNLALQYYEQSANQGNSYADYTLGYLYHQGVLVSKNDETAMFYLQRGAERGSVDACRKLVEIYLENGKDLTQLITWTQKAAEKGCMRSTNSLGWYHENGIGLPKDEKQAVIYYRNAANNGNAISQANMGWCYFYGIGLDEDKEQADQWFQKAAAQNSPFALGFCFAHGIGGKPQDAAQAFTHYKEAAENGHQRAQLELAVCYHHGCGVTQNLNEAAAWYHKAFIAGFTLAKEHLDKLLAEHPELIDAVATLKSGSSAGDGKNEQHSEGEKKQTPIASDTSFAAPRATAALPAGLSLGSIMADVGLFPAHGTSNQPSAGDPKASVVESKLQM